MPPAFFNLRARSLARGTILVLGSLVMSFLLSGFPNTHPSLKLMIPAFVALYGTYDTARCLRLRWSFYHGGVLLLLYTDVMALAMIFFLLLYPYAQWIQ
ncbi:permease [Alloacidobacterium dinghuense]|uniref:Permease n=2 Tax=Alloacidobacterium dinghuense TaxID=2763107 RepID=A0A7G8BQK8_9BACT|nr:permease [Alloacidobacterium dinghuense]